MDELGFNKIAAAILAVALAFLGIRLIAEAVVPEHEFEAIYVPDVVLDTQEGPVEEDPTVNDVEFIAAMDPARGANVFKKCLSCHNAEPGGANGTGPALYGVMGRQMGTHPGFGYSSAMQSKAAPWTWEEMNGFLTKPATWLPGTNMNYIGLKKWEDRAAVMAYLNTTTNTPLPMPEAVAPEVEETEIVEGPELGEGVDPDAVESEDMETTEDGDTVMAEQDTAGEVSNDFVEGSAEETDMAEAEEVEEGPMDRSQVLEFLNRKTDTQ